VRLRITGTAFAPPEERNVLKAVVAILGMAAVGLLVWRLLERQGPATPPTDDEE
jgi:hypothetical protein